jgi:hypothetical protein
MNTKPGCVGCKWAKWDMAGRKRLTKLTVGRCQWPVPELPKVPVVFSIQIRNESAIWPDYDKVCPVREEATT